MSRRSSKKSQVARWRMQCGGFHRLTGLAVTGGCKLNRGPIQNSSRPLLPFSPCVFSDAPTPDLDHAQTTPTGTRPTPRCNLDMEIERRPWSRHCPIASVLAHIDTLSSHKANTLYSPSPQVLRTASNPSSITPLLSPLNLITTKKQYPNGSVRQSLIHSRYYGP